VVHYQLISLARIEQNRKVETGIKAHFEPVVHYQLISLARIEQNLKVRTEVKSQFEPAVQYQLISSARIEQNLNSSYSGQNLISPLLTGPVPV